MREGAWKISTFAAIGVAGFLALRPAAPASSADKAQAKAAHHASGGGILAWLGMGGGSSSSEAIAPRTGTHLQQLRDARNTGEQCEALRVLALEATGDEEATDTIGDYASAAHPRAVRYCAVSALEKIRSGAAHSYLADLVQDSDRHVRGAALRALASQANDDEGARSTVIAAAHSSDRDTRLEALIALGDAHVTEASSLLQDAIAHETGDVRTRLIAALGETHDTNAVSAINGMLDDGDSQTRAAALEALGSVGGDAAIKVLEDKLQNGTSEDVSAAALALAKTGDPGAKQALLDALAKGRGDQRISALHALAQLDGDDVRQTMQASLSSTDPRIVATSASWFSSHGDASAVPDLTAALKTAPPQARASIVSVLASIGGDQAREAIATMARSGGIDQMTALNHLANMPGGRDEARRIALSIAKGGGQNTGSAIEVLAQDATPESRDAIAAIARAGGDYAGNAMSVLAQRGDSDSMRALTDLARTAKTPELRGQAIASLASTGDPKATPLLVSAAQDKDPVIRRAAVAGLARAGGDGAERALVAAASDSDAATRETAIRSLGSLHTASATSELEQLAGADGAGAPEAFRTLANSAPDRAVAIADRAMNSSSSELRDAVVSSASELPTADAQRILTSALHDTDDTVASSAVSGLASLGGDSAQQALLDLLSSNASDALKRAAADALDRSGTPMAQQHSDLVGRYKSKDDTGAVKVTASDEDEDLD